MSKPKDLVCEIFANRLNSAMSMRGFEDKISVRAKELSRVCNSTPQGARRWVRGECLPGPDNLEHIARHLNVTKSYLFGEEAGKGEVTPSPFPIDHVIVPCTTDAFDGEIRCGDSLVVYPVRDAIVDGSLYLQERGETQLVIRLWSAEADKIDVVAVEPGGIKEMTITGQDAITNYLSGLRGQIVAVIRKV